jgi:hypothetical protein
MDKATQAERDYFERLGRHTRAFAATDNRPPRSLQESLDRLADMRRSHGALANAGAADPDARGDLDSHLAFLEHIRAVLKRRGISSG